MSPWSGQRARWRFGVHTTFWVLSTYYKLDLALVSADCPYEDFTEEAL